MKNQRGFTLIEVLIVVSIIGILASVVLVGLGGFRSRGYDTKRIGDLHQVQLGLELYNNTVGNYPTMTCANYTDRACWKNLETALVNAGIGISKIANDPNLASSYGYVSNGSKYTLGAQLQDASNPALNDSLTASNPSGLACAKASGQYCVSF